MKRCLLFCQLAFFSTYAAHAQFTASDDGLNIGAGTDVYINGLTLRPSLPAQISNVTQEISDIPVSGSPSGIARVYLFDAPINVAGRIGFFYDDTELNANTESALKLTIGDPTYTSATNTVIDQVLNYIYADYASPVNFDRVTAATENALPVTLVQFTAKKEGTIAQLNWKTAVESNSSYFEIQRSFDAKVWSALGKVTAAGDSKESRDYTFNDNSPLGGNNLYRLKLVDTDGSFAYSGIKNLMMDVTISTSVYPNPASDKLLVSLDDWSKVQHVKLIDGSGRLLVDASDKKSAAEIDIKAYPSGMYLLQVVRSDGNTQTVKVVKR